MFEFIYLFFICVAVVSGIVIIFKLGDKLRKKGVI